MEISASIKELAGALAKAQLAFLPILQKEDVDFLTKTGQRKKYSYASLAEVIEACRKGLSENGLAIMQPTKMVDNRLVVETLLAHSSGEWIRSEIQIDSQEQSPQGIGSALTYARRYSLTSLLGVASEEDDDGESAMKDGEKKPKAEKPAEKATGSTQEHWCKEHNVAFQKNTRKDGATWYSHKQGDLWCNEDKGKAKAEVVKPEPKAVIVPPTTEQKARIDEVYGEEKPDEKPKVNKPSPPITAPMLATINSNATKMKYSSPELSALVKHAYEVDDLHGLNVEQGKSLLGMIERGEKAPS